MAHPTRKGQKVMVYRKKENAYVVDNFLGARQEKLHDNILDAMKEKPGCNAG